MCVYHHASFLSYYDLFNIISVNVLDQFTMRCNGRDSALGTGRKLSIIRPGATTVVAP